jgi:transposase
LIEHFNWKKLSAIGTLITTPGGRQVRLALRLIPGTIKSPQVKTFLGALRRYLNGRKLVLLWDRLMAHRSRSTQRYLDKQRAWLTTVFFPPYAPEKNPIEYFWAYVSNTDMANFCADHLGQVRQQVKKAAGRVRRRRDLGRAFLKHSSLF